MHLSGKAQQIPTSPASEDPIDITPNTAVAENSVAGTSPDNYKRDATAEVSIKSDARCSKPNLTDTSFPFLQHLRGDIRLDISGQKASLADTLSFCEHFQPCGFLKLPYEIRHMIYELVVGVNQQVHIKSNLQSNNIPMSIIPCSDHSPAACLQDTLANGLSYPKLHYQGTAVFSHAPHTSSPTDLQTMTVCYDMQTGEQKVTAKDISSCHQSAPFQGLANSNSGMDGLRVLRTCRQIYDEARLVLYNRNTFVFLNFATFAAYFGLAVPTEVYMPRLTEPHRLRAIHSMTKVELHGKVSDIWVQAVRFSWASRLIRMGLGCLTSLTSFELKLGYIWEDRLKTWNTDDCLFSKPSSLKKLVVTIRNMDSAGLYERAVTEPHLLILQRRESLMIAEEIMRRMVKEEGFHDMEEHLFDRGLIEGFWT